MRYAHTDLSMNVERGSNGPQASHIRIVVHGVIVIPGLLQNRISIPILVSHRPPFAFRYNVLGCSGYAL
jgi:hypothetical protein